MELVGLVEDFFSRQSLARFLDLYEARESQVLMAREVARVMEEGGVSLIEGGTGVGKTLAYLVPSAVFALEADSRVVISTSTKSLQDQLLLKDLPVVHGMFRERGHSFMAASLKGRNNYLCLSRLKAAVDGGEADQRMVEWSRETPSGDLESAPQPDAVYRLGSRWEYCLGKACPYKDACFYQKAWKRAEEASLLLVNHHLLLSHLVAERKGLPFFERLIIDEAHRLERVALEVMGRSCSLSLMLKQVRSLVELGLLLGGEETFLEGLRNLQKRLEQSMRVLSSMVPVGRISCEEMQKLSVVEEEMSNLSMAMEETAFKGEGWLRRQEEEVSLHREIALGVGELMDGAVTLQMWSEGEANVVRWVESRAGEFPWVSFHLTPMEVFSLLEEALFSLVEGAVLTSATLSVAGSMAHIREALGVPGHAVELFLPQEFSYEDQVRLVVFKDMPLPDSPQYRERLLEALNAILDERGGQTLLLFTAYRMMEEAVGILKRSFPHLTFYVQGDGGRDALVNAFKQDAQGVLAGVESFWEGIDLPGECLRTLVLVKLPFRSPQDPMVAARSRWYQEQGKNPFMDYLLPEAVLVFRQGFGRLIRSKEDRGVVYLLDSRVLDRSYGAVFLSSLPEGVSVEMAELGRW